MDKGRQEDIKAERKTVKAKFIKTWLEENVYFTFSRNLLMIFSLLDSLCLLKDVKNLIELIDLCMIIFSKTMDLIKIV
jgi:hypothetical protein